MAGYGPEPPRKKQTFVLCFDGTGNKFSGTDSDSNILKIYRLLDRNREHQFHYYQPGIGTYVTSTSLSHTSVFTRCYSAYQKAKDSAVGTSFDQHVMGGYKFLMRYYNPGDDIYFFGFSRGAYIARFLAEMLDYVGLLSAGNEELTRFAWKTFSKWQQRHGGNEEDEKEKKKLFTFMRNFRETFSRPVSRIRFLGLFDTVNSVPRFESAWMQRSKFPYTARSSAKVVRHAVGIDERRAKFRQDLIAATNAAEHRHRHRHYWPHRPSQARQTERGDDRPSVVPSIVLNDSGEREPHQIDGAAHQFAPSITTNGRLGRFRRSSPANAGRSTSLARPVSTISNEDLTSMKSGPSQTSLQVPPDQAALPVELEDETSQDIQEVWFPGCHADIGGGWPRAPGESWPLSHTPLVWMVHEAQKAGLPFDEDRMRELQCWQEPFSVAWQDHGTQTLDFAATEKTDRLQSSDQRSTAENSTFDETIASSFHKALHLSGTQGSIHDCLEFNNGIRNLSVFCWNLMEYLPFRRMDLQSDGSWKPIRWPLPCGEVRDIPNNAQVHNSVIRRMEANKNYRPGNLIVGGGGRGVRVAPEKFGIGEWTVLKDHGDLVREVYIRQVSKTDDKTDEKI